MGGSDRKIDRFHMPTLVLPNKIDPHPLVMHPGPPLPLENLMIDREMARKTETA